MSAGDRRASGGHRGRQDLTLRDDGGRDGPGWLRGLMALAGTGLTAGLGLLVVTTPERAALLPELVDEHLAASGVSNPVTAVLLNFRSYDTLLEVAVLVVAMAVVWSLDRDGQPLGRDVSELADPFVMSLARLVVPLTGVTAVTLAWAGTHGAGGAFQAAALLAGAGVLLTTAGLLRPPTAERAAVRVVAASAVYLCVGVGVGVAAVTGQLLAYPAGWAYPLIVVIEAVLTVSIAVILVQLFVDVPAVPEPDPELEQLDPTGDPLGRALALRRREQAEGVRDPTRRRP